MVVGGGPAGVACALALQARGLRVAITDRQLRGTRGTPAETLPGRVRAVLGALGVADVLDDWCCAPVHDHRARWGPVVRERSLGREPHGHSWQVERDRFDELLRARAAERGIELRMGMRCTAIAPDAGGGWRITLEQDRGRCSVRAAFVVDATGRSAFVARRLGARRTRCDRSIALLAGMLGPAASRGATLVEVCPTGWWRAATLASGDVALHLVTDAALLPPTAAARAAAFLERLRASPQIERYLAGCGSPAWLRVASASPAVTSPAAGNGWLAIGDAAAIHDPLACSGVAKALDQGLAAATTITAWLGGDGFALDRHRTAADREFHAHLAARRADYAATGMSRFAFWRDRAAPEPVPAAPAAAASTAALDAAQLRAPA
jgi:flavin-dependent dehydrogenase